MGLLRRLTLLITVLTFLTNCGQPTSHRQSQRDQNEANTTAEMTDLQPAEADYIGTMHLLKSKQDFQFNLSIKRVYENVRPTQLQDPTQTINLPKLSGFLKFPVLDRVDLTDYTRYSELVNPMGGYSTILFDFGDYDPKTHILILPYNVSGYTQGNFGELQGHLNNGVFKGTWFAKPLGIVGRFETKQNKSTSENQ